MIEANFDSEDGLFGSVQTITSDSQGNLWFGTTEAGVVRYDGKDWTRYTNNDGLAADEILSSAATADGSVWFGTYQGLSRYYRDEWTTFTTQDGLQSDAVYSLQVGKDGTMWLGHFEGITEFDGSNWKSIAVGTEIRNSLWIRSIAESENGIIWAGTYADGILGLAEGRWVNLSVPSAILHNEVSAIHTSTDGSVWVGYQSGISIHKNGKWNSNLFSDRIAERISWPWEIQSTSSGQVWIVSDSGLIVVDGQKWQYTSGLAGIATGSLVL